MDAFYSKLKMEGITADEYKRAQEMWSTYKCKNMQDFPMFTSSLMLFYWLIVWKIFAE